MRFVWFFAPICAVLIAAPATPQAQSPDSSIDRALGQCVVGDRLVLPRYADGQVEALAQVARSTGREQVYANALAQGIDPNTARSQLQAAARTAVADLRASAACLAASSEAPGTALSRLTSGDVGEVGASLSQACARAVMTNYITACHNTWLARAPAPPAPAAGFTKTSPPGSNLDNPYAAGPPTRCARLEQAGQTSWRNVCGAPIVVGWMDEGACSPAGGRWSCPVRRIAPGERSPAPGLFGRAQFGVCFNTDTFAPQDNAAYACIGARSDLRHAYGVANGPPLPPRALVERDPGGQGALVFVPPPPMPPPPAIPAPQLGSERSLFSPASVVKGPTPEAMDRHYPFRALYRNVSGTAKVECIVPGELGATRTLTCNILSESPAGFGFGEAALQLALNEMTFKPNTWVSQPSGRELSESGNVVFNVNFSLH